MFSKKRIKAEITLMDDKYHPEKTLVIEDLPIQAQIEYVGFPSTPKARIKIYGVSKEYMDEITTIQLFSRFVQNRRIRISVDEGNGYEILFDGGIVNAFPVYNSAPNVYIQIESSPLQYQNFEVLPPTKVPDTGESVFMTVKRICDLYGLKAENCMTSNIMSKGTIYDQAGARERLYAVERYNDIKLIFTTNNIVRVFNKDDKKIMAQFNLTVDDYVGYPTFNSCGIEVTLDKLIPIECRDIFTISGSEVGFANTSWQCYKKTYNLQNLNSAGKWEMKLLGVYHVIEK